MCQQEGKQGARKKKKAAQNLRSRRKNYRNIRNGRLRSLQPGMKGSDTADQPGSTLLFADGAVFFVDDFSIGIRTLKNHVKAP